MTKKHSTLRRFIRRGLNPVLLTAFALPGAALAGPLGGEVIRGEATIAKPDDFNTVINQASERAVVNWQSFSVGGNEFVVFNQPSASSVILNRVIGNDASEIFGSINANGRVFLVNPNGIFFGEGATLDVNGLVASTLDIDSDDFMDGNYRFHRAEGAGDGEVRNAGVINADDGGFVVLAGDYVENTGVIAARLGHVVMASGAEMTLDMDGTGLIGFAVNDATLSELAGVRNAGEILADGSMVIMTAKVARDLLSTVVNNEGLIAANSVEERSGVIYLRGEGGHVEHSGTMIADAADDGVDGGRIGVLSDNDITLSDGSSISADALGDAEGGFIQIIADDRLSFEQGASISAQGDAKGGFVEVSGYKWIGLEGDITIGNGGELFIDPETLTLVPGTGLPDGDGTDATVGVEYVESQLNAGTHVRLTATGTVTADPAVTNLSATDPGGGDLRISIGQPTDRWDTTEDPINPVPLDPVDDADCLDFGVCLWVDPYMINAGAADPGGQILLGGVDFNLYGSLIVTATKGTVELGDINIINGNFQALFSHTVRTGAITVSQVIDSPFNPGTLDLGQANIQVDSWDDTPAATIEIGGPIDAGRVILSIHQQGSGTGTDTMLTGDISAQQIFIRGMDHNGDARPLDITTGNLTLLEPDTGLLANPSDPSVNDNPDYFQILVERLYNTELNPVPTAPLAITTGNLTGTEHGRIHFNIQNATGSVTTGDIVAGRQVWFEMWQWPLDLTTGDITIVNNTGRAWGQFSVGGDTSTGAVFVRGTPSSPPQLDFDDFVIADSDIDFWNPTGGDITINGDFDVATLSPAGFARAQLFAPLGTIHITGNVDFTTGEHPLFSPPAFQIDENGVFVRTHDMLLDGGHILIDGDVTNNFSLRAFAGWGLPGQTGGTLEIGNIDAHRVILRSSGTATVGDVNLTRSIAVFSLDDQTVGNITQISPDGPDSVDPIQHVGAQAVLESVNGSITAGNIHSDGYRFSNVILRGQQVTVGEIVAIVRAATWDSEDPNLGFTWTMPGEFFWPVINSGTAVMGTAWVDLGQTGAESVTVTGDITIDGVAGSFLAVRADDVQFDGTVSMSASGGSAEGSGPLTESATPLQGSTVDGSAEVVFEGGRANLNIDAPNSVTFAQNLDIIAPSVNMRIDTGTLSAQGINVTGTGESLEVRVFDTDEVLVGREVREGGYVTVRLDGTSATIAAPMTVSGSGVVEVDLHFDDILMQALNVTSAIGSALSDGVYGVVPGADDTGAWESGDALVRIGTGAGDVGVAGAIALSGFGDVELDIYGNDIAVGGAITADAGAAEVVRTMTTTEFDPDGNEYTQVRTDTGTRARAWIDIEGDGVVSLGSVSASGGEAEIMLGGHGSLQTGALSATGSGVTLTEEAVWTGLNGDDSFTMSHTMNGGPATVDVYGGAVSTGTITVNGTGGGWISVEADDGYTTGDVTLTIGDGSFTTLDTRISGDPISVSGGVAALMVTGDGAVAGDVQISASGAVYLGGTPSASGTISISAGDKVSTTLPADLAQMLADSDIDHPFEDDLEPVELPPLSMQAGAVGMSAGTLIDLGGGVVTADGPLHLASGGDIRLSGATLTAGTLILQADGNIQNQAAATLSGGAVLLEASGDIALGASSLSISGGALAALTGDPDALQVLIDAGLLDEAITPDAMLRAGGSLALDSLAFDGGYLVLVANGFSLGSFDGPEGDYLLQATPTSAETDIVLTGTVAGAVTISWDEFLSLFDGATYILGASDFDGTITTGRTTELDIGDANMLFASSGPVPGLSDVATTGLILNLEGVVVAPPPPPPPPPPEEPPESRDTSTPTESEIVGSEPSSSQVRTTTRPAQRDSDDDRDDEDVDVDRVEDDPDADDSITHDSDDDLVCE